VFGHQEIPASTAVLQIPRGQERKFDTKRDAKFGAPSTAALAFIGNSVFLKLTT
jgi:hypothetical protein